MSSCQGATSPCAGRGEALSPCWPFGEGVSSAAGTVRPPLGFELTDRIVCNLRVDADAGPRARHRVVTPEQLHSNAFDIVVADPDPARPALSR
jgi:hypothetical protein